MNQLTISKFILFWAAFHPDVVRGLCHHCELTSGVGCRGERSAPKLLSSCSGAERLCQWYTCCQARAHHICICHPCMQGHGSLYLRDVWVQSASCNCSNRSCDVNAEQNKRCATQDGGDYSTCLVQYAYAAMRNALTNLQTGFHVSLAFQRVGEMCGSMQDCKLPALVVGMCDQTTWKSRRSDC